MEYCTWRGSIVKRTCSRVLADDADGGIDVVCERHQEALERRLYRKERRLYRKERRLYRKERRLDREHRLMIRALNRGFNTRPLKEKVLTVMVLVTVCVLIAALVVPAKG